MQIQKRGATSMFPISRVHTVVCWKYVAPSVEFGTKRNRPFPVFVNVWRFSRIIAAYFVQLLVDEFLAETEVRNLLASAETLEVKRKRNALEGIDYNSISKLGGEI